MIAFVLPINDIIPANMALLSFLLEPSNIDLDDSAITAGNALNTYVTMAGNWVELSASLPNTPLKMVYSVSALNLACDLLRNNIQLIIINLLLLVLSMMSIYFIRRQYIPLSESIAVELEAERALNQEIITSLPCGLLVYNFASNRVIISNKIDELLLEALLSINQKGLAMFNHFHLDVDQRYIIDASALHKVISLLVNNAITTTAYGKVSLVIDHKTGHTDRLIFHINDTGSSISDEEISNLSYPFLSQTQMDRFNHGSGLTFFLCNQLCNKLNGQLNICSKVDIGTRHTIRIAIEMEKKAAEKQGKLLDGVTALLDITSKEVCGIVNEQLQAYSADCLVDEDRQINCDYDLLLTDNPQRTDDDTLLLAGDKMVQQQLGKRYIRVNYNLSDVMLDVVLMLLEQQLAVPEQEKNPLMLNIEDIQPYEKQKTI